MAKSVRTLPYKDRLAFHLQALEKYNAWESEHPQMLSPTVALASIGYLYQLMPTEAKQRDLNVGGIIRMRNILSKLKSKK